MTGKDPYTWQGDLSGQELVEEVSSKEDRGDLDLTLQIEKLQAEVRALKVELANARDINHEHQYYNGKLYADINKLNRRIGEVLKDNSVLAIEVSEKSNIIRKLQEK